MQRQTRARGGQIVFWSHWIWLVRIHRRAGNLKIHQSGCEGFIQPRPPTVHAICSASSQAKRCLSALSQREARRVVVLNPSADHGSIDTSQGWTGGERRPCRGEATLPGTPFRSLALPGIPRTLSKGVAEGGSGVSENRAAFYGYPGPPSAMGAELFAGLLAVASACGTLAPSPLAIRPRTPCPRGEARTGLAPLPRSPAARPCAPSLRSAAVYSRVPWHAVRFLPAGTLACPRTPCPSCYLPTGLAPLPR
jgi:hypothetical protein